MMSQWIATFQPHSQSSLLQVPKEWEFYYTNAILLSFNGTTDKIHSISVWTEHVKHTTSARAVSLSTTTWKRWNSFSHWHHNRHWHQKRFKTLQLIPCYGIEAVLFSINQLSFRQSLFPTSPKGNTFSLRPVDKKPSAQAFLLFEGCKTSESDKYRRMSVRPCWSIIHESFMNWERQAYAKEPDLIQQQQVYAGVVEDQRNCESLWFIV